MNFVFSSWNIDFSSRYTHSNAVSEFCSSNEVTLLHTFFLNDSIIFLDDSPKSSTNEQYSNRPCYPHHFTKLICVEQCCDSDQTKTLPCTIDALTIRTKQKQESSSCDIYLPFGIYLMVHQSMQRNLISIRELNVIYI